ncbi:hypothetical protein EW146_g959 [Bondarzewia mesenterica]|uniref:Uncharacterized protein n=1 Tax=Bondarzewia mesenterica TaxID=1095465 RepID=A0A4S4M6P2_9AGAM|nr:hypothetical protein EW146_g959 [Bondarzewia mesenterica]
MRDAQTLRMTRALAPLVTPRANTASVRFECGWTCVMSILALAASIDATVSGPPVLCQPAAPFSVCASATVLVPVSWLASTLMLAYFVMIFGTSVAHLESHPNIWICSFYSIPWFVDCEDKRPSVPQLPPLIPHEPIRQSVIQRAPTMNFSLPKDVEQGPQPGSPAQASVAQASVSTSSLPATIKSSISSIFSRARTGRNTPQPLPPPRAIHSRDEEFKPWWIRQRPLRPGKDQPFAIRPAFPSTSRPRPSQPIWKGKGRDPANSPGFPRMTKEVKPYQGSWIFPEKETKLDLPPYPQFPEGPFDPDKPIDIGRLSAWVRADEARGIKLSTMPRPHTGEFRAYRK